MAAQASSKPCSRCKTPDAPHTLRNASSCPSVHVLSSYTADSFLISDSLTEACSSACYIAFIDLKIARRITLVHRHTRPDTTSSIRYLAGLSLGPCSSVLTHEINRSILRRQESKSSIGDFDALVVHIDTSLSGGSSSAEILVKKFQEEYPALDIRTVPLERVLEVRTVDWATLPVGSKDQDPTTRLRTLFENLPSISSKSDVLRHLVRHLLVYLAREGDYSAVLLGHTTTTLAALTLSEVANGRGFSVPYHVDDGDYPTTTYDPLTPGSVLAKSTFPIFYPLREIFSGEASTYITLTPSLSALTSDTSLESAAVVSHKDLAISEVMARYFSSVEGPYAGIVTNVVRTTGKLERAAPVADAAACGLCGIALDKRGDETWAGELGEQTGQGSQRLCYGCKRSVNG